MFRIGFPNHPEFPRGTAFALDIQNKRYLVTASHVIEGMSEGNVIHIVRDKKWLPLEATVVGRGDANDPANDIAVLATNVRLPVDIDIPFNTSVVDVF